MPNVYDQGVQVRVTVTFTNVLGALVDPSTVVLRVGKPGGTVTTYTWAAAQVIHDSPGVFHYDIDTSGGPAGLWEYRFIAAGAAVAEAAGAFYIRVLNV